MDHRYQWLHLSLAVHLEAGYTTCSYIPGNRQSILHGQVLSGWFVQRPTSGLPTRWKRLMRRWSKIRPSCLKWCKLILGESRLKQTRKASDWKITIVRYFLSGPHQTVFIGLWSVDPLVFLSRGCPLIPGILCSSTASVLLAQSLILEGLETCSVHKVCFYVMLLLLLLNLAKH